MIDFKEEMNKYKPVLEVDGVEAAVRSDEIKDLMDMLQHITDQITADKE